MSNSLIPDETPSYSASHPDLSCLLTTAWLPVDSDVVKSDLDGRPTCPNLLDDTVTTGYLGWVVASYSLGQLFAAPLFGAWANYRGKAREPLIVSLFIDVPAHVLYMYLESIPTYTKVFMIVARCMVGFASGNIAVIRSYVAGATTLEERTGAMGHMAVFQSLGIILGPLLQAALVPIGYPGFIHETALSLNMYTKKLYMPAVILSCTRLLVFSPLLLSEINNNNTFETPEVYRSRWRSIRVMYFTMIASNVSLTILFSSTFPFLKILDDTVTTGYLGWVVASYSLGQLFAAPLFGAWANYRGKAREPLIVSLFIDVPAHVLYMYLESIPTYAKVFMIVARCMVGFASGNIAVIRSYVALATTLEERTGAMAHMAVFQSLGFILGPLLQAALVPIGYPGFIHETALSLNMYTFTGLLCAIFDVINLVLLIVVFREHVIDDVVTSPEKGTKSPDDVSDDDTRPLDYVAVISTIVIFFVVMFAFIVIETICTPLCMHSFAWTKAEATLYVGIILGVGGFLSIAVFVVVRFLATMYSTS